MRLRGMLLKTFVTATCTLLLLAGCSQNASQPSDMTPDATPPSTGEDPSAIVVVQAAPLDTLDPGYAESGDDVRLVYHLFEGLVKYSDEGVGVEPGLAHSWTSSDDGLEWTFHLREGLTFHDGTPVNADAVVFSYQRLIDPEHPYYLVGGSWSYFDYLLGGEIEAIEAVDDLTVRIVLKRPFAPLLTHLAYYPGGVISPAALEKLGEDFGKNPVGAGPFQLKEWRTDGTVVIEAFADYWAGPPPAGTVVFRPVPEAGTRLLELRSGNADVMVAVPPEMQDAVRGDADLELVQVAGANLSWILMNPEVEPAFQDIRVRQALAHAVDVDTIVEELWGGLAVRAVNPYPSTMACWNDELEPYAYDVERARELLAAAGYGDGLDLVFHYSNTPRPYMPDPAGIAQAVAAQLQLVGVTVTLQEHEWTEYLALTGERQLGLHINGWYDVPEPDNFTRVMLVNTDYSRGDFGPEMGELLDQAVRTYDEEERCSLYRRAQQIFHETVDRIPLAHSQYVDAIRADLKGFVLHPSGPELLRRAHK